MKILFWFMTACFALTFYEWNDSQKMCQGLINQIRDERQLSRQKDTLIAKYEDTKSLLEYTNRQRDTICVLITKQRDFYKNEYNDLSNQITKAFKQ